MGLAAAAAVPPAAGREEAGEMKTHHFLKQVDHDRLHRAIDQAERGTSVRMVVYITHRSVSDPVDAAQAVFRKLGLEKKSQSCGFLIFLSPKSQTFAVLGGSTLHQKVGQAWWDELARVLSLHFQKGDYTEGLLTATGMAELEFRRFFTSEGPPDANANIVED